MMWADHVMEPAGGAALGAGPTESAASRPLDLNIRNFNLLPNAGSNFPNRVRATRNVTSAHGYYYRSQSSAGAGSQSRPGSSYQRGERMTYMGAAAYERDRVTYNPGAERVTYNPAATASSTPPHGGGSSFEQHGGAVPSSQAHQPPQQEAQQQQTATVPWWERLTTTKTGNLRGETHLLGCRREDMDLKTREERLRYRSSTNLHEGAPRIEYVSPRSELWLQPQSGRRLNRPKSAHYASKRPPL
mmetsp:Transcript_5167/g.13066  ORF Transcript_5167/g.13066 Transcript_5167/m.13066 type:complete len:245 (-) Transcript_5167:323-1057(-)